MRVRFTRAFDWRPPEDLRITLSYREGQEANVRVGCGLAAIAAGAAERLVEPDAAPAEIVEAVASPTSRKQRRA